MTCVRVKEFLSRNGIAFEDRNVLENEAYKRELTERYGLSTVPVTIIDGEVFLGFDARRLAAALDIPWQVPDFAGPKEGY